MYKWQGTPRRKKKIVHKMATDDKKVQVSVHKLCMVVLCSAIDVTVCVLLECSEEARSEQHSRN